MSAKLMAIPDMVIVENDIGKTTGTTSISYEKSTDAIRPILWERFVGKPWTIIELKPPRIISSPSGDPEIDGVFSTTMAPGKVYQVVMYHEHVPSIDPNVLDPNAPQNQNVEDRPDALLTVVAMLKKPDPSNLITDQNTNTGGTWFFKQVATNVPTSFQFQVSKDKPFKDADGVDRFISPLGTVIGLQATTNHTGEVQNLLPGNDFFSLARVVDTKGNWQVVIDQRRTKQRTVKIDFGKLHIINDGANGETTAEFRIWVMEGNTSVKDFFFGNIDNFPIWDKGADNGPEDSSEWNKEFIKLSQRTDFGLPLLPFILGPKDVTNDTFDIGILTRGLCYRTFGPNDHTSNFGIGDNFPNPTAFVPRNAKFPFPTGSGKENVNNRSFTVRARPQTVDVEFEYELTVFFTVTYN